MRIKQYKDMNTKQTPDKKMLWIQSLRGVAALMVLCFHLAPHWETTFPLSFLSNAMRWGFSGVDIFFTLSGFVVYKTAKRAIYQNRLLEFIKHRLLRVYLGYWTILIFFAIGSILYLQRPLPEVKKAIFSVFLLYPNIWDNWLTPAWSLSFELIFYAWIVVIILSNRLRPHVVIAYSILFLSIWNVSWIVFDRNLIYNGLQPIRYVFNAFGIEFLMGALIYELYESRGELKFRSELMFPLANALILVGFVVASTSPLFNNIEILRIGSLGLAGLGFLLLFLHFESSKRVPPRWLVAIGDASYSLYLLHTFLLDVFATARNHLSQILTPEWANLLYLVAIPISIVLFSIMWYRIVERPLLKWALQKF